MKKRKRNRMQGFDYSSDNLYFVTICVQDRLCCFGSVGTGRDLSVHPNESNPNESNPNESNPNESNPNESNPNESNPNESNPNESNPNESNPNESNPNESNPNESNPNESNPNESNPNESNPNESNPNESNPNESNPNESNPNESNPNESNPNESNPNESNPNESNPNESNPNESNPNESNPNESNPNESNKKMELNEFGKIVQDRIFWLAEQYQYIAIHNYVIMPNHVHAIIEIDSGKLLVRKSHDLSVRDEDIKIKTLSSLIGAFKTTSSKIIHQAGFLNFEWQRSFHDHIIRNEKSYFNISNYIDTNPEKWRIDTFFETLK